MKKFRDGFRNLCIAGSVGMAGLAMSQPSWAGPLADAVEAEVTTAKAEILVVGALVLGALGVLLLLSLVKRGAKG